MRDERPSIWIIAGPNGAGKTTYAFRHIRAVSGTARFVNLDEIARGLSPLDPQADGRRAARVALDMMHALVKERASFSLETTLSGRTHLGLIGRAAQAGFQVNLLFFAVGSVETSLARIARRVSEGGHDVPDLDVRRRFARGWRNVPVYAETVDLWRVFDNNGPRPVAVAEGRRGCRAMLATDLAGLPSGFPDLLNGLPTCPEAD
jgi:predicted ABC-type ATPase